jgi:hypothetical protein
MKYLIALLASLLSAWYFYFLVAAFFPQFESLPVILVWLASFVLFIVSVNVAHVISRLFFILAVETIVAPAAALLHMLTSDRDFLLSLQSEGQDPALIRYLVASGWDTEQVVLTSLAFTLIFAIFSFYLSPEKFATR